jgi:putative DNA primase/helicase
LATSCLPISLSDHGQHARYVPAWKRWLFWDDRRWKRDETGEALRRAQLTVRGLYAAAAYRETAAERTLLLKQARRADQWRRMEAFLRLAATHHALVLTPEQIDADPWLLNCENGVVDLRSGLRREHRMADLMTKLAPVTHDPAAVCPTFERFLGRILGEEADMLAFLQRAIGYGLSGSVRDQCFFVLHGPGANGKSTLLSTIRGLLGDYALGVDMETLLATKRPGQGANPDLVRLRGARFVTATEGTAERRLADGLLKRITGGDPIVAGISTSRAPRSSSPASSSFSP